MLPGGQLVHGDHGRAGLLPSQLQHGEQVQRHRAHVRQRPHLRVKNMYFSCINYFLLHLIKCRQNIWHGIGVYCCSLLPILCASQSISYQPFVELFSQPDSSNSCSRLLPCGNKFLGNLIEDRANGKSLCNKLPDKSVSNTHFSKWCTVLRCPLECSSAIRCSATIDLWFDGNCHLDPAVVRWRSTAMKPVDIRH